LHVNLRQVEITQNYYKKEKLYYAFKTKFLCQAVVYADTPTGIGLYAKELRRDARGIQTGNRRVA